MLKLVVAYLLIVAPMDKLWLYALSMVVVSLIVRSVYALYCKRHFTECHFVWGFDKRLLSKMFVFSGWAFLGNGVVVLKDQGGNILLNIFGGPAVNAARGIAVQVNAAVYSFVSNFMQASNPQITKNFASGNLESMHTLIIKSTKFGFLILLLFLLPLSANIDFVLRLWLVEAPSHTTNFIILTLLYSLAECLVSPLTTGMLAQGNIKPFEITLTFIYLANFIVAYFCLKSGMIVETLFILNIIFKVIVLVALLRHSSLKYAFPVVRFLRECCLPSLSVFLVSASFAYVLPGQQIMNFESFVLRVMIIVALTAIAVYFIGMNKQEKKYARTFLRDKVAIRFTRR